MMVAVSEVISCSVLQSPDILEVITVNVGVPLLFTLCVIYIPPSASDVYHNSLMSYLYSLTLSAQNLVLAGDFNFLDINWSSLTGASQISDLFCDFIFNNNLVQLVQSPTHVRGSILDLVLTNCEDRIFNTKVHEPSETLISTDHFMVTFEYREEGVGDRSSVGCKQSMLVYDYSKADWVGLSDHLLVADFDIGLEDDDVELIWATIKHNITTAMDLFIPKVRLKKRQLPAWFTPQLQNQRDRCVRGTKCLSILSVSPG